MKLPSSSLTIYTMVWADGWKAHENEEKFGCFSSKEEELICEPPLIFVLHSFISFFFLVVI